MSSKLYNHKETEAKWQATWERIKLDVADIVQANNPFYNLMMFPYPSAEGLHVGNMYAFTGSDIYGRYKRLQGFNVFEPIGLDGFGIHSENYCIKIGKHPLEHAKVTQENFYRQLKLIGAMFDWSRTLETYDPSYYRWTQWIFTQLFKKGLVYRAKAAVNWCPGCKTVLADEQVIAGACERCNSVVQQRELSQWFFRITAYADRLYDNIPSLNWSDKVRLAQKNWIGKKEGVSIRFSVCDSTGSQMGSIDCFTTRPDTLYGVSFVVLSVDHPFINQILKVLSSQEIATVTNYIDSSRKLSMEDLQKSQKTGISTGLYCVNPLTKENIPLFIANYVMGNVGTGAVMGVPAHDSRDFEFAAGMKLPITQVVREKDKKDHPIKSLDDVYEGEGELINSSQFTGMSTMDAREAITKALATHGIGKRITHYHLRDWLISRQRYWGPPIPMIFCAHCQEQGKSYFTHYDIKNNDLLYKMTVSDIDAMAGWYPVPENALPVELPYIEDFKPGDDGVAPLKKHTEFYKTVCPGCGQEAVRETDVSDTFLDSSWYFLRYPSLSNGQTTNEDAWDPEITKKWLPVSMYTGGAEHSVLHLLYARFITMAFADIGLLPMEEPFAHFFAHGLVIKEGAKMSKSKGNVVNPDEYITAYGADALRLYLMFMGPYSDGGDFRDTAMEGMSRWVNKVFRIHHDVLESSHTESARVVTLALHRLIKKGSDHIEKRQYNTVISSMMEFINTVSDANMQVTIHDWQQFLIVLSPFAPHLSEELWQSAAGRGELDTKEDSIHFSSWPVYDPQFLLDDDVTIVVQVNGKVRDRVVVPRADGEDKPSLEAAARKAASVQKYIEGKQIKRVIVVPYKLVNFVVV